MTDKKREIDMTQGFLFRNIVRLAIPFMITNILQVLYNAADFFVVSRWSGTTAMAAVGATGALADLLINAFIGVSIGATIVVSKKYGAHDSGGVHRAVHTAVLFALMLGFFAAIVGFIFTRPLLLIMNTPEGEVLDGAILYMKIIFIGVPASLTYNFGAAILRGVGNAKKPLCIAAISGFLNVMLNMVFVIVFKMDVGGVALATTISYFVSAFMVIRTLMCEESIYKLYFKKLKIYKEEIYEIVRVGLPAGIQTSLFSFGNTVIQSALNLFGAAAIAGSTAALYIEGFIATTMSSLGQTNITAVSQNYGAKKEDRINKSIKISVLNVIVVGIVLGGLCAIFAKQILGIFIKDSVEALEFGINRILFICLPHCLNGIVSVLAGTLRGFGYSSLATVNSLASSCGLRVLWIIFIFPFCKTPQMLFACWPIAWIAEIILHTISLLTVKKKAMQKMYEI